MKSFLCEFLMKASPNFCLPDVALQPLSRDSQFGNKHCVHGLRRQAKRDRALDGNRGLAMSQSGVPLRSPHSLSSQATMLIVFRGQGWWKFSDARLQNCSKLGGSA